MSRCCVIFVGGLTLASTLILSAPTFAQRDHVLCYKVKPTLHEAKFPRGVTAALDDTLDANNPLGLDPNRIPGESFNFGVAKVPEVCVASDKNGEGLLDPDTHWVMYSLKASKGACENDSAIACRRNDDCDSVGGSCGLHATKFDKKLPRNTSVRVVDRFNDVRVDFAKEKALLVPATLDAGAFQGVPAAGDHYKCYDIKPTKSSCVGGPDDGAICRTDDDCSGGTCARNLKFPRQTHPDGLEANVQNAFTSAFDASDPSKPYDLRKLKMFCQATSKKLVGQGVEAIDEAQAGLLCYASKGAKKACSGGSNDGTACRKDDACPGGVCRQEPKFDNRDPKALAYFVEDQLFQHRFDFRKEDLFCVPACKEPPATDVFSPHVLRLDALQLAPTGHAFGGALAGFANPIIASSVAGGSINLLLEAQRLADGPQEINSYTGTLDPTNAGCGVGDPEQSCDYLVDATALDPSQFKTRTSCGRAGAIVIPVDMNGTDTEPDATVAGGGAGTSFNFELPIISGVAIHVAARNVTLSGDLTHGAGTISSMSNGQLTGTVIQREFADTIEALPDGLCQGGGNDNEPCAFSDALCPGGACNSVSGVCSGGANDGVQCGDDSSCPDARGANPSDACNEFYAAGFTVDQVLPLISAVPRDSDLDGIKTCEGATNSGEPCETLTDCPDQNGSQGAFCDQNEGSSIILQFSGIDAAISGVAP